MNHCRREGENSITVLVSSASGGASGEPVPPEVFVEESNQICPVSSGDVLAGGHGHQAGVEDGGGHEAQLGWREITQEWSEQGPLLGGQRGNVFLLQIKSK